MNHKEENISIEVKVPKKRGRKPKNEANKILEPKIPKKRGRKPKIKTEEEIKKVPKKRGRKPHSLINTETKVIQENKYLKDNVLHLKIDTENLDENNLMNNICTYNPEIKNPEPYENNDNLFKRINLPIENTLKIEDDNNISSNNDNNDNDNSDDFNLENDNYDEKNNNLNLNKNIQKKYCKVSLKKNKTKSLMVYYNEYNKRREWPKTSDIKCFWCCHNFDCIPCAIPTKYQNNNFYVFGNFCSKECAASYNFEMNDNNVWERYSLLNHLYSILTDNKDLKIKLAPSRLCLSIFGGNLSIEEFRSCNEDYSLNYKVVFPPMISVIPSVEEIKKDVLKNNKPIYIPIDKERIMKVNNDLRLKRKKPITNKNTLENCMKLTYN